MVSRTWPAVRSVDTGARTRTEPHTTDVHEEGRAADIMTSNVQLGTEIADYFATHAQLYGIQLLIWRGTMVVFSEHQAPTVSRYTGASDHDDHVHAEVGPDSDSAPGWSQGQSGTIRAIIGLASLLIGLAASRGA